MRTTGSRDLRVADLQRALHVVLQSEGTFDLKFYLRHFEKCHWKTSPVLSLPGLAKTEPLWRELLAVAPGGVWLSAMLRFLVYHALTHDKIVGDSDVKVVLPTKMRSALSGMAATVRINYSPMPDEDFLDNMSCTIRAQLAKLREVRSSLVRMISSLMMI